MSTAFWRFVAFIRFLPLLELIQGTTQGICIRGAGKLYWQNSVNIHENRTTIFFSLIDFIELSTSLPHQPGQAFTSSEETVGCDQIMPIEPVCLLSKGIILKDSRGRNGLTVSDTAQPPMSG